MVVVIHRYRWISQRTDEPRRLIELNMAAKPRRSEMKTSSSRIPLLASLVMSNAAASNARFESHHIQCVGLSGTSFAPLLIFR